MAFSFGTWPRNGFAQFTHLAERVGLPQTQRHRKGHKVPVPELQRICNLAHASSEAVAKAIRAIQDTKAVRHGDRVLKKKSADLQCCN